MKEQHYINNDIPIRFDTLVEGRGVAAHSVKVSVYFGPDAKFLMSKIINPNTSEVLFVLDKKYNTKSGPLTFIFDCDLRKYGVQSHTVKIQTKRLPVSAKISEKRRKELAAA